MPSTYKPVESGLDCRRGMKATMCSQPTGRGWKDHIFAEGPALRLPQLVAPFTLSGSRSGYRSGPTTVPPGDLRSPEASSIQGSLRGVKRVKTCGTCNCGRRLNSARITPSGFGDPALHGPNFWTGLNGAKTRMSAVSTQAPNKWLPRLWPLRFKAPGWGHGPAIWDGWASPT